MNKEKSDHHTETDSDIRVGLLLLNEYQRLHRHILKLVNGHSLYLLQRLNFQVSNFWNLYHYI